MSLDTPPSSTESKQKKAKKSSKHENPSRIQHTNPSGLRQGINRLMNMILECENPVEQAGRYASLANAMTNSQKMSFEIGDFRKLQLEVDALKEKLKQ